MMWFLWWTLYHNVVLKLWRYVQRKSFSGSSESITLRALPRRIKHRCAGCYGCCCCLYRHHCCGLTSRSTRETQHHLWVSECVWDLFENYHLRCLLLYSVCSSSLRFDHQQQWRLRTAAEEQRGGGGYEGVSPSREAPENMILMSLQIDDLQGAQHERCHFGAIISHHYILPRSNGFT